MQVRTPPKQRIPGIVSKTGNVKPPIRQYTLLRMAGLNYCYDKLNNYSSYKYNVSCYKRFRSRRFEDRHRTKAMKIIKGRQDDDYDSDLLTKLP